PGIGFLEPALQADRRRPVKLAPDFGVIRIAPAHALRRIELVAALELEAGDILHHSHHLVDGDKLVAAQIERLAAIALQDAQGAFRAIVDVDEASRLLAVAPDVDGVIAGDFRLRHLAADRRRRLLAPAIVGAEGSIAVVIARHARGDEIILHEVPRHAL